MWFMCRPATSSQYQESRLSVSVHDKNSYDGTEIKKMEWIQKKKLELHLSVEAARI